MPLNYKLTSRNSLTIVRALDDDYYEVRTPQGRTHYIQLKRCSECEGWTRPRPSGLCAVCIQDERDRQRRASIEASSRRHKIANLSVAARKRAAKMSLAAPKWRDRDKINALYEEARRLTAETGVVHHVDHYYPLQGQLCSGLHVHQNLRILPASENCSKGNATPLDESPATVAFIKEYGESGLRVWINWAKRRTGQFKPVYVPTMPRPRYRPKL